MANYDFLCQSCNDEFTINVAIEKRNNRHTCKHCGSDNVKRIYSPFYMRIQTDREAMGKKAGLNVERYKAVRDMREKRKKEGDENNSLWAGGASKKIDLPDRLRIDGYKKVEGNNVINLKP
jgi:putative FmdB family regulatory protein